MIVGEFTAETQNIEGSRIILFADGMYRYKIYKRNI